MCPEGTVEGEYLKCHGSCWPLHSPGEEQGLVIRFHTITVAALGLLTFASAR